MTTPRTFSSLLDEYLNLRAADRSAADWGGIYHTAGAKDARLAELRAALDAMAPPAEPAASSAADAWVDRWI